MEGEARRALPELYKKYGITEIPPKRKKKKKKATDWVKGVLQRFKRKKKKKGITLPSGVRTPAQIREWREIMGLPRRTRQERTSVITGVRG